ncbi:MAG: nucleotide sugar dehydrogenase [Victivallales bacterium]|jgi:UDP-N-acetyl-D-galactosamine dehydrogenase|nr:nucleotide sugar dehydrogenase [Victivallales bacterium]
MLEKITNGTAKIALIGLGYVGLPLAVAFGKKFDTIGFDIKKSRIEELKNGCDRTQETSSSDLADAKKLRFSNSPEDLRHCDFYIVTVPTPVDRFNTPDLSPLYSASETVGKVISPGAVVIYESTVYPGCTEEQCVPVIERASNLSFNRDFFCGYSPERINPGDKEHTLEKILKITSGSTPEVAGQVDALYRSIIKAGTFRASSLKVAEAAKVIENSQRDLNIAFVNELSKIFRLLNIDTREVLEAAGTKWNFLHFQPGLVGGHCIGVDPYYLTHKATELGYHPEVILAGRRINDSMGRYAATEVVKLMIRNNSKIMNSKVLQLGITFKENCPDIRNSRAVDVANTLAEFGCKVDICDPHADPAEVKKYYNLNSFSTLDGIDLADYEAVILAVSHCEFKQLNPEKFKENKSVIYDIKAMWPRNQVDGRL